jgi:hypothetical protein
MPPGPGARSPEGFPLGDWASHVRAQHRADELAATDRVAIEAIPGWAWDEVSGPT